MMWAAIGQDWKSLLVFLVKEPGKKGVCSQAYLNQMLKAVVFPYYDKLSAKQKAEFRFMEDGAKVHAGKARLPRLNRGMRGFDWPPSSPDLNPIEKIWRWMKNEITKLETVLTLIKDIKQVLQEL